MNAGSVQGNAVQPVHSDDTAAAGPAGAARLLRGMRQIALMAATGVAVALGAQAAVAQDAFLSARMTVSAPAGAHNLCGRYPWACQNAGAGKPVAGHHLELAIQVNRQINRQVRSISDQAQYARPEHWALPTAQGGDCEDFALIKKKRLIEAGLDPRMLLVSTVLDRNRNAHAVLVMRTSQGDFILDNLRDEVLHWRQTGYTFLRMQDPSNPARWTAVIDGGILRNNNAVATPRLARVAAPSQAPATVPAAKISFSR
ncbi:MAG: transglutaminase-like cysteine peptidase [Rhodobacterales bacterium]|nr:transglutaminase-like cysteine peptidase [Rhodobacterales bacterium]